MRVLRAARLSVQLGLAVEAGGYTAARLRAAGPKCGISPGGRERRRGGQAGGGEAGGGVVCSGYRESQTQGQNYTAEPNAQGGRGRARPGGEQGGRARRGRVGVVWMWGQAVGAGRQRPLRRCRAWRAMQGRGGGGGRKYQPKLGGGAGAFQGLQGFVSPLTNNKTPSQPCHTEKGVSASRVWRELSKMAELDAVAAAAPAAAAAVPAAGAAEGGGGAKGSRGGGGGGSARLAAALELCLEWGALQALLPGVSQVWVRVCVSRTDCGIKQLQAGGCGHSVG